MGAVAAVDCGATSIRVCCVDLDARPLVPEVIYRVTHVPWRDARGHLRWNWTAITDAVVGGLERCLKRGRIDSIGIDTWAVDYGLLDERGALIGDPYSYRDHRSDDYRKCVDAFGAAEMYRINGLQLQPFNTIFQLAAHDRAELDRAERLLWLPELLAYGLTGQPITERTSAASSGLLDLATGGWSVPLCDVAGIHPSLLGEIESAGCRIGEWRGVPVHLVGGHDTASAVAGMGPTSPGGSAFVSSGTWMLVGVERDRPDTSEWARQRNFTNEAGAMGGTRLLRNVSGFWVLERCRAQWGDQSIDALLAQAASVRGDVAVVDVDHEDLRAPDDMLASCCDHARLPVSASPGVVTRSIVESIARKTNEVVGQLAEVSQFDEVVLFGGAVRMRLLGERLTALTGLSIRPGAAEAAALGNAVVQAIALGVFKDLGEGRQAIAGGGRT